MTEFEALQQLLPKQLIKLFRARAEAYFADKGMHEEYDKDGLWRYWAAVIAHGIVQYSTERDAYVVEKSSIDGLLGNGLLRKLHTFERFGQTARFIDATGQNHDGPLVEDDVIFDTQILNDLKHSPFVGPPGREDHFAD